MWYIFEVPKFFFFNLISTTLILVVLSFGIPPVVNWLTEKMNKEH